MHLMLVFAVCAVVSYLLGAIPFGYIIASTRGIDLYKTGSGSIGATNVFRTVGKKWGILTFVLDALKGFIPAFLFPIAAKAYTGNCDPHLLALTCAIFAVIGHNWPVYLNFKGGKGIATSAGALAGIVPEMVGIGLLTWVLLFLLTRYVSVASITAAFMLIFCGWVLYCQDGFVLPVTLTILGLFAIWRHKSNIQRLMNGTENRFDFRRKKDEEQAVNDNK